MKTYLFLGALFFTGLFVGVGGMRLIERRVVDRAFKQMKAPFDERVERVTQLVKRKANLDPEQTEKARTIVVDILKRLEPKRNDFFLGVSSGYYELVERLTPELRGNQTLSMPGIEYVAESLAAAVDGTPEGVEKGSSEPTP
jgi:hypothetical protein